MTRLNGKSTSISNDCIGSFAQHELIYKRILNRSPYELTFDLPFGSFSVDYENGPYVTEGEAKKLSLKVGNVSFVEQVVSIKLLLPEDWTAAPAAECVLMIQCPNVSAKAVTITPGAFDSAYFYLPVEIRLSDRFNPYIVYVPFQKQGSVDYSLPLE